MKLSEIKDNTYVFVKGMTGGRRFIERLNNLGIITGQKILIKKNDKKGPVIINLFDRNVILGQGMSDKIIVTSEK